MSSGMRGHNGLDPETNLHLVKTYIYIYVIPVLLYGLELILPNRTLMNKLEIYQKKCLNKSYHFQQIPRMLQCTWCQEAQIDKRVLSLFHNVTVQDDSSVEKQLAKRQLTVKSDKSNSWYIHVKKTLMKYCMNLTTFRITKKRRLRRLHGKRM